MAAIPPGAFCDHSQMTEHCDGCGHFYCPCGIAWDEGAEGGPFMLDQEDPPVEDPTQCA